MLSQKDLNDIEAAITALAIKKALKLKINGIKVKVVRNANGSYGTYSAGHWIADDDDPKAAFELVKSLLNIKSY